MFQRYEQTYIFSLSSASFSLFAVFSLLEAVSS